MDQDQKAPVMRRRILKAAQESLADSLNDPYWAQLEENSGFSLTGTSSNAQETMVVISGENVLECDLDHADLAYLCNERAITNFQRKVPMPGPVVPERVEATMEDGVLRVKLPKKVETGATGVTIKVS